MASQFQVNIQVSAGLEFYQEFYLTNPDLSPLDLTAYRFYASLQKHANAKDVIAEQTYKSVAIQFDVNVVDPQEGIYSLSLGMDKTEDLEEGKYVYSVVAQEPNGHHEEVTAGLAFVDRAFGLVKNQETSEP